MDLMSLSVEAAQVGSRGHRPALLTCADLYCYPMHGAVQLCT